MNTEEVLRGWKIGVEGGRKEVKIKKENYIVEGKFDEIGVRVKLLKRGRALKGCNLVGWRKSFRNNRRNCNVKKEMDMC